MCLYLSDLIFPISRGSQPFWTSHVRKPVPNLVILECMKMEMTITAPIAGKILEIRSIPGKMVSVGQILVVIQESI